MDIFRNTNLTLMVGPLQPNPNFFNAVGDIWFSIVDLKTVDSVNVHVGTPELILAVQDLTKRLSWVMAPSLKAPIPQ